MKVSELSGAMLDMWVARAAGKCATVQPNVWGNACINELGRLSIVKGSWNCAKYFDPSKNWAHGGPIIESELIEVSYMPDKLQGIPRWYANQHLSVNFEGGVSHVGETCLVAAMRCYVALKFGAEVPDQEEK